MSVNSIQGTPGRLGNHFIRAHAAHFLAKKFNIVFNYGQFYILMKELGIHFFEEGKKVSENSVTITDKNFDDIFFKLYENESSQNTSICLESFCQTKKFSNFLYNYYKKEENRNPIIEKNYFKERYNNNNDLFVHVRLDDTSQWNAGYEYYDKILSTIKFDKGFISSDEINHPICKKLIEKYNLEIIDYPEVQTIMFGSTCRYVVLTSGSFSFMIGLLSFFSKIYYIKQLNLWCPPDLYRIDDWTEVDL